MASSAFGQTENEPSVIDPTLLSRNPGTFEDLNKKTKDLYPIIFEGFKFTLNKVISTHFQINHNIILSSVVPSGYKFGATYVGVNQISASEVYPIVLGDMDSNGNLNTNIIHQFHPNVRTRVVAQIADGILAGYQMTNDYKGNDFTASITAVNSDIIQNSGVLIGHYLQRVSKNLDLGCELLVQYGRNVPNNRMALYSVGWRYFGNMWQFSGVVNPLGSLHLCYYHQSKSPLQFGVELETNLRTMESSSSFSYQVDLSKANMTFKGMVDSNWTAGAVLEKRLLPLPFTFVLSGFLNHVKASYKFGIGFTIG
ncbi:mitochondrial import receptor subunit TOM40 -like protein [Brachionus plicatilis]|uniref:Mitochondrial import receptor subunit TOM40-like protein n=1 Tax=Brachionus plicatilis TaxID=10195 RepID=A0A3M7PUG3_BRAPC|nr:mitochondrial import receptor subunit TOM40 -like protein [Brachionus plicatilis]